MSYRPTKSEIVPGLLLNGGMFGEVMVLAAPNSRGMVLCEVFGRDGATHRVRIPMQSLRWQ